MKGVPAKTCPSCGERYDADVLFCPRDGTPLASSRNPSLGGAERDAYLGTELPGQIKLEHLIGIGSMGRVYRAHQGGIDRDVAVKVLHRELSGNAELVARFHREAKVASRLVHPNVVQVLMTGALPKGHDAATGGELYLVMEYLDGISLLSALAAAGTSGEGQALPLPRALHVALQICDAAGEAHAQGIVHRDLKPENVMLVRRGDDPDYVKILDFGIARLDWADRGMATQAGLIFGTAKYISPEGAEGQAVGPQADVYSIATMLYQMLAGRTPFEGDSPVALLVQHTHAPPPPLRSIARASYVPEPLATAIMQNLSKKPAERAPNARALGRDLIAAARASGLFPEEIATQSTLLSPASLGAVKLQSKERTRSHELSAEMAGKIGGVAAGRPITEYVGEPSISAAPTPSPAPAHPAPAQPTPGSILAGFVKRSEISMTIPEAPSPAATMVQPPPLPATPTPLPFTPTPLPDSRPVAAAPRSDPEAARARIPTPAPSSPVSMSPRSARPGDTPVEIPPAASSQPAAPAPVSLPEQPAPVTTTAKPEGAAPRGAPQRQRWARLAIIAACSLAVVPAAVIGGKRLAGGAAQTESVEASLEEARECMRKRAWDAPPGKNFKEITDGALKRWPDSHALIELRREAAVSLVNDALGRKYQNDGVEATRLAQLALEMDPDLMTAQHLAAELASARVPEVAPSGSASGKPMKRVELPRLPRPLQPQVPSANPRLPDPGKPPPLPSAALPPPTPPRPPQSTGPWL
jgi:serine/threonine-protein kinase